ncbi:CGNR zinc finger domain-containing protein [Tsukamurella sp. 8F]|uniref:CGNR zinc finger domain-containing protein n=1 Tax=unclassified Tsukamurella TaxID=2633480 RepID=UPI0023B90085|nr:MULTISPECIES: CGNR zinc finger domain-containing protein [unclassified Tsukamurella]MDF0532289.1 CGNR zinc finger domain-containing protein [Tsukamurella sp. 8J]MDF0589008.1 CGNR zinc finger domain-containing protein [Tsukamurella sp. 8F]
MDFSHDTEPSLVMAAELLNSARGDAGDLLDSGTELRAFFRRHHMTGWRDAVEADLDSVHELRERLAAVWAAPDTPTVATLVNELLADTPQQPHLVKHGKFDWHLHFVDDHAPITVRLRTEMAMALVDLVRSANVDRLKTCAADGCDHVLVDLTRNRSRRFCSTGNCANRTHVAAYRERRALRHDDAADG